MAEKDSASIRLPRGTTAWLPEQCRRLREAETRLREIFADAGASEIASPTLEFASVLERGFGHAESLFRVPDSDGALLALRPELTTPAARLFATALRDRPLPLRSYYMGQVFRQQEAHRGLLREFRQVGFECYGGDAGREDEATIRLASRALETLGASTDAVVAIGHVGLVEALLDECGVKESSRAAIADAVGRKNFSALEKLGAPASVAKLARLGGGPDSFQAAQALSTAKAYLAALDEFRRLSEALQDLPLRVTREFAAVRRIAYYTGMVFEVSLPGWGEAVLSGGRYDRLVSEFGAPCGATGFSLELERLLRR